MALTASIEFTQLLQLYNTLAASHTLLIQVEEELHRLAEVEMIPVRIRVDTRTIQVIGEQMALLIAAMQKASS